MLDSLSAFNVLELPMLRKWIQKSLLLHSSLLSLRWNASLPDGPQRQKNQRPRNEAEMQGCCASQPRGVFRSARAFSYPQSFVGGQNWVCGSSWVSSLSSSPHTLQSLCLHGHIIIWVGWTHCYFWEENQKEVGRETKRCEKENTHD